MRTETIEIFKFEELSKEAKKNAIELQRNELYKHNDFSEWAIDDCYLLNPPYREVEKLDNTLVDSILIKNTREKFYFSLGRDRFIDISNAMEIVSNDVFLEWLGVTDRMIKDDSVYFTIGKDTIEFEENDCEQEFKERDLRILDRAKEKYENHCEDILNCIEESIDYNFTDEAILESIECNDYEFTSNGEQH